jgi:DNA-binding MarR family transcriptional regulator
MTTLKNPARHDDLLNYRLKRLLSLGGAPAIRLCEGGYGIARQEWRLVAALVEGGPLTVGELRRRSGVEPARVSRGVQQLVHKGFVERAADAAGRPRALLVPTQRGHALYGELFPQLAAINRRLMDVLREDEATFLDELLRRLTVQAQAIQEEGGGVAVKTGRYLGTARRSAGLRPGAAAGAAFGR